MRLPAMPRFYFHLYNDVTTFDEGGRELPSAEHARLEARQEVATLAANEVLESRKLGLGHRIDVVDEHGHCVAAVRFRDVVQIEE